MSHSFDLVCARQRSTDTWRDGGGRVTVVGAVHTGDVVKQQTLEIHLKCGA